jgi:ribosomal-protein-alanine N-acetyltransferase
MNYISAYFDTMSTLKTERLALRPFNLGDAAFVIELVNSPGWIQFIGDRNIHSIADAEHYISNNHLENYKEKGFGYWVIFCKENLKIPIGICGLMKRDGLEHMDIGYALLPKFEGLGYATEAAQSVLTFGFNTLKATRILAISDVENIGSAKVLQKIGMALERKIKVTTDEPELYLFSVEAPK